MRVRKFGFVTLSHWFISQLVAHWAGGPCIVFVSTQEKVPQELLDKLLSEKACDNIGICLVPE